MHFKRDSIFDQLKVLGDSAYLKSLEISKKLDETGFKDTLSTKTSTFINKGLELSTEMYLKTSDKLVELNVIPIN